MLFYFNFLANYTHIAYRYVYTLLCKVKPFFYLFAVYNVKFFCFNILGAQQGGRYQLLVVS